LTLPGNTFSVNYANGTPVSLSGSYGNANAATFLAAYGSNTVSTTGNITSGNLLTGGLISATGNVTGGNVTTGGSVNATANITGGNVTTGGVVTATGNVTGGNLVTAGNVQTENIVNITANTSIGMGNGSGIVAIYSAGNATQFAPSGQITLGGASQIVGGTFGGSGIKLGGSQTDIFQNRGGNVTVQVGTGGSIANTWTFAQSGAFLAPGAVSAVGNITGGNVATAGLVTATGNITGGNILTGGLISASGNATVGNISAINHTGTTASVTGNITGGNVLTGGLISAAGNISSGNVNVASGGTLTVNSIQAINGPAFSAYANATGQTITSGSQQKVLFQTEEFDTNNNYANSRFTPTVAGYYQLNAEVRLDGVSGTGEMMIVLYKNGTEYKRGTNQSGVQIASNFWAMTVSSLAYANGTTDYFEIYVQQGSGGSITVTAVNNPAITWFNGCMMRGA
jgi:hypothetical protein